MTLIAGFPENDYVLLASDTEESGSDGIGKSHVWKIDAVDKSPQCALLIGGAGDGNFVDEAVQQIDERLAAPYSWQSIASCVHSVVLDLHFQIDRSYADAKRDDHAFHLLSAVWINGSGVRLMQTTRGLSTFIDQPISLGIGSYLGDYLIDLLYMPKQAQRTLSSNRRLATYIIGESTKHVRECGGEPKIVWLTQDGHVHSSDHKTILTDLRSSHIFSHTIFRSMWHSLDDHSGSQALKNAQARIAKAAKKASR